MHKTWIRNAFELLFKLLHLSHVINLSNARLNNPVFPQNTPETICISAELGSVCFIHITDWLFSVLSSYCVISLKWRERNFFYLTMILVLISVVTFYVYHFSCYHLSLCINMEFANDGPLMGSNMCFHIPVKLLKLFQAWIWSIWHFWIIFWTILRHTPTVLLNLPS